LSVSLSEKSVSRSIVSKRAMFECVSRFYGGNPPIFLFANLPMSPGHYFFDSAKMPFYRFVTSKGTAMSPDGFAQWPRPL
jgi:hypothetical protein